MGRPERAIDPTDRSPAADFARSLRTLRSEAGNPTLRVLQQRTGFSDSTLSAALSGRSRPSLEVVQALVQALGADPQEWTRRWQDTFPGAASPVPPQPEPAPSARTEDGDRPVARRPWLLAAAAALLVAMGVLVGLLLGDDDDDDDARSAAPPSASAGAADGEEVVVHNVVTDGATAMREDTAAYLSTRPEIYCKSRGCAVEGGPQYRTSDRLTVSCQVAGDRTTNGDDSTTADDANPGLYSSTLWYGVPLPDGGLGYLSEVWVDADHRGGLGLPECPGA
ncbi:helix-turn-helix domain-containing protein [Geodermatophilus sp. URMC 64]